MLIKDEEIEQPIPTEWKNILTTIVDDLKSHKCRSKQVGKFRYVVNPKDVDRIYANIDEYGDPLISLPQQAWKTSICRWMRNYWDIVVDLYTDSEGASDLALFVESYEDGGSYRFEIQSVHVP